MNKLEELANTIKSACFCENCKCYYYPNIPDKVLEKLLKNFEQSINITSVIAFIDTTLTGNGKNGIAFTTQGLYWRDLMTKAYYFNYNDINNIYIQPDKKNCTNSISANLTVKLKNGESVLFGYGSFYKENLKEVFLSLKEQSSKLNISQSRKQSGQVGELHLTKDEKIKCNSIIHTASVAAGGVGTGMAQLPVADAAVITPIQISMIISLGAVFGMKITDGIAKGIMGGATGALVGRGATQILIGWIPGLGNAINTATAAGLTEAIGWMAVSHFFNLKQSGSYVDGIKKGYEDASYQYEEKLRKQAELFIKQKKVYEKQIKDYEALIANYEIFIKELQNKEDKTDYDYAYLIRCQDTYDTLCLLR